MRAQELLGNFERTGNVVTGKQALDILDDLIDEGGPDSQRGERLKSRFRQITLHRFAQIIERGTGFKKRGNLEDDINALFGSLSRDDGKELNRLIDLLELV
jgi:hypothetical protein